MSVNAKMTAIADEIRELSGTAEPMGLDAMAAHVGDANEEVAEQTELIEQIYLALEGKAMDGTPLFTSRAKGTLPKVYKGAASTIFSPDFASSATGALQEG